MEGISNSPPDSSPSSPSSTIVSLETNQPTESSSIETIKGVAEYNRLKPETLALVAQHSDKYLCNQALGCWINWWLCAPQEPKSVANCPLTFAAAHLFETRARSLLVSSDMLRDLPFDFSMEWSKNEILDTIPDQVKDILQEQISQAKTTISEMIHRIGWTLNGDMVFFAYEKTIVYRRGQVFTHRVRKCSTCRSRLMHQKLCTNDVRFNEYFKAMDNAFLWPVMEYHHNLSSISDKIKGMARSLEPGSSHKYQGGVLCPLRVKMRELSDSVELLINNVKIRIPGKDGRSFRDSIR
ncbi:hypothetical protein PT974_07137 [Cladobotryum mycophilum]|uniref:Uncharacterized protein n=1 Tax=Cladobotryum mycophilum TaxID=491253 RepID=A0ABR0SNF7_9HYPO